MISQSEQSKRPLYEGWRDMTQQLHRAVKSIFRKVFSKIARSFGISATLTRITKADMVECLQRVVSVAPLVSSKMNE